MKTLISFVLGFISCAFLFSGLVMGNSPIICYCLSFACLLLAFFICHKIHKTKQKEYFDRFKKKW